MKIRTHRVVVLCLFALGVLALASVAVLAYTGRDVPESLNVSAAGVVTALAAAYQWRPSRPEGGTHGQVPDDETGG
jgi:hypothetical protein